MNEQSLKVYKLIATIPQGKVITYKHVSDHLGMNNPRLVGKILHNNPNPAKYPCHRIVSSNGSLAENFAFGGLKGQKEKLEAEGVKISSNGTVDLKRYLYLFVG